jgi:hypothetical protein
MEIRIELAFVLLEIGMLILTLGLFFTVYIRDHLLDRPNRGGALD